MALMRQNPVPPGWYWVDYAKPEYTRADGSQGTVNVYDWANPWTPAPDSELLPNGGAKFEQWLASNAQTVVTRSTEVDSDSGAVWRLVQVLQPTDYPAKDIGFWLTVGRPGMTKADTVQRPDPEPGLGDQITQFGERMKSIATVFVVIAGIGLLGVLAANVRKATR
jgi:hypothetical protein